MDPHQRWSGDFGIKRVSNALQNKKIGESNVNIQKSTARSLITILLADSKFTDKLSKAKFNENDFGNQLKKIVNIQTLPAFLNEFSENEADEVYQFIAKGLNGILPETAVGITESQVDVEQNIKALAKYSPDKDITVFRFQNIMNFKNPQNVWRFITASIGAKRLSGLTVKKGNFSFPLIRNKNSWTLHKIFDSSEYPNWEKAIIGCSELEMLPEMLIYTESQEMLEEFKVTKDINDKIKLLQSYIQQSDYYIPSTIKTDFHSKLRLLRKVRNAAPNTAPQQVRDAALNTAPQQVRDTALNTPPHIQAQDKNLRGNELPHIDAFEKQGNIPEPQKKAFNEEGDEDLPDIGSFHPKDEALKNQDIGKIPMKLMPSPFNRAPPATSFQNALTIPKAPKTAKIDDLPSNYPSNPLIANFQPIPMNKNNENPQNTEKDPIPSVSNEIKQPPLFVPKVFIPINSRQNPIISPIPSQNRPAENEESLPNIENSPFQVKTATEFKPPIFIPKQMSSANNPAAFDNDKPKPFPPQKLISNAATPEDAISSVTRQPQIPAFFTIPKVQVKDLNSSGESQEIPGPFPKTQPKQPQITPNVVPPPFPFQGLPKFPPPQMPILNKPAVFNIPVKKESESFDAKIGAKAVDSGSEEESEEESENENEEESESESEEDSSNSEEKPNEIESIIESKLPSKQLPIKADPLGANFQQINPQNNAPVNTQFNPSLFPKTPIPSQQPKQNLQNQDQLRKIPQKFVSKDDPQIIPPKREEEKALTAFKNPELILQPPDFAKVPNSPPMPKPQKPEIQDPEEYWICEFCTLNNPIDIYICNCCAKTNDRQKAHVLNLKY